MRPRSRRNTSTGARSRSTAAPTRSRRISSRRQYWGFDFFSLSPLLRGEGGPPERSAGGPVTGSFTTSEKPLTRLAATLLATLSPLRGAREERKRNGLRTFRRTAAVERLGRAAHHAALRLRDAQEVHGRAGWLEPRHVAAICRAWPDRAPLR